MFLPQLLITLQIIKSRLFLINTVILHQTISRNYTHGWENTTKHSGDPCDEVPLYRSLGPCLSELQCSSRYLVLPRIKVTFEQLPGQAHSVEQSQITSIFQKVKQRVCPVTHRLTDKLVPLNMPPVGDRIFLSIRNKSPVFLMTIRYKSIGIRNV